MSEKLITFANVNPNNTEESEPHVTSVIQRPLVGLVY